MDNFNFVQVRATPYKLLLVLFLRIVLVSEITPSVGWAEVFGGDDLGAPSADGVEPDPTPEGDGEPGGGGSGGIDCEASISAGEPVCKYKSVRDGKDEEARVGCKCDTSWEGAPDCCQACPASNQPVPYCSFNPGSGPIPCFCPK